MKNTKTILFGLICILSISLILLVACKKDEEPDPQPPVYTDGQGEIGKLGGTIIVDDPNSPINGASIFIPEGALSEDHLIKIEQFKDTLTLVDPKTIILKISPSGLSFDKAVEIGIPWTYEYNPNEDIKAYHYSIEQGSRNEIEIKEVDSNNKITYAYTDHFSLFYTDAIDHDFDIQLVKVGNTLGGFYHLETSLDSIPPIGKLMPYTHAAHIIEDRNGNNCYVRIDFTVYKRLLFGIVTPVARQSFYFRYQRTYGHPPGWEFWIDKSVQFHPNAPVEVEEIFFKQVNDFEEMTEVWMSGFPLLAIFDETTFNDPDFSWSSDDRYRLSASWTVVQDYNAFLALFCWTHSYGWNTDWFYLDDLETFTGDANMNHIVDSYESSGGTPSADFTAFPTSGTAPHKVYFTDESMGNPKSWQWNFGDGNTSSEQHPEHIYQNAGYYSVQLTVNNNAGSNTKVKEDYIRVGVSGNNPVVHVETPSSPQSGNITINYTVDAQEGDLHRFVFSYQSPGTGTNPMTIISSSIGAVTEQGVIIDVPAGSHSFIWDSYADYPDNTTNQMKIRVAWRNPIGGQEYAGESDYFTVNNSQTNNPPVAAFSGTPTSGTAPLTVSFTDQSSNNPTSWQWSFGDGNTSTMQNPQHTYNNPGSYTVELTVENNYGSDTKLKSNYITVSDENGDPDPGTVTDIDGNVYQTVIIGNQEWMAENLRVTRDADGNDITRYCYDNDPDWCELYGGLYTWHTVMNGQSSSGNNPSGVQGICPTGWHVPSDAEWTELLNYLDSQGFPNSNVTGGAGNALKSCRQVGSPLGGECDTSEHPRWNSDGTHYGFDEFGFSALPGSFRWSSGIFNDIGIYGYWWSSTESSSSSAWYRNIYHDIGVVYRLVDSKPYGFSVRCVRD